MNQLWRQRKVIRSRSRKAVTLFDDLRPNKRATAIGANIFLSPLICILKTQRSFRAAIVLVRIDVEDIFPRPRKSPFPSWSARRLKSVTLNLGGAKAWPMESKKLTGREGTAVAPCR